MMERVTVRFPEEQVEAVEQLVEDGVYPNRSEAIRAALEEETGVSKDADQETRRRDPSDPHPQTPTTEQSATQATSSGTSSGSQLPQKLQRASIPDDD